MPPVVPFLLQVAMSTVSLVAGTSVAMGLSAGAALAIGAAVVVGGALVAYKAMSLFEVDIPTVDTDASRQRTVKSTTEPQKIIYGQALVSGPISFIALAGTDNEDLYQTVVLAGHKLNNITDIHMDDLVIPNADIGSGNAAGGQVDGSGPFGFKNSTAICTFNKHLGDASQTADSLLTPLTDYTTSHRGDGIAYLAMKWTLNEHSAKTWEKYSPQNVKALVQGKSIYDPRLDVTAGNDAGANPTNASYIAYSTNPALCLADYLMDATLGMGISAAKIDWAAIITAANGCDVSVSVPGGTEARFSCNGVIFATDKHQKNINKILSSMNGNLVYSNGKYILHAGIYEAPTESLNEDDLIGAISIKTSLERSDRFNTIKGLFVDPSQNHKSSEFPKVQLADAVTRDNGEVLEKEVQYPMTNSSYGAQRLSHKLIQLSDQQKIITFPANLSALRIAAGDRVQVTVEELSWTNKVFQCVDWTFSEQGGVNLTLREDSSTSYADPTVTPTNEYSTITASGSITDAFRGVPSPSGLRAASGEGKVFLNWVNPGRPADYATIEVFSSSTNNVNNAVKIGDTDGTQFVHDGNNAADSIAVGNDRHYWIRSKKNVGTTVSEVSVYEPNSTTSSVTLEVLATAVNWSNVANPTIGVDINSDTISINTGTATTTTGQAVANSGLNSGGLTMNTGGSIKGGQSAYNSGTGFFLGYDSGYKFSIGNSSTQALTFDGSNLSVTGNITATSGTFTGTVNASAGAFTGDVSTDSKFIAGSSNDIAVMDGGNALYRFYAGNSVPESAAFRVDKDGHIDAANIRVYDENGQVILDATGLHGVGLGNISANSGVGVSEVAGRLDNNADEITFTTGASSETYTFEPKVQIDINQTGESGENPNTSNLSFAAASESAVTTMIGQVKLIVEYFVKASGGSYSGTPTATEEFTFVSGTSATSSQFGVNVLTINSRGVGIIYADIGAAEAISDPSIAGARTFVRSSKNLTFSSAGTYNVKVNARIATLAGTTLTTSTTPALDSSLSGTGVILGTDETQSSLEDFRRLYAIKPASGNTRTIIASSTDDTFVSTSGSSLLNTGGTISGDLVITGDLTVQGTTTTINVADLTVADKDITLNYSTGDSSSTANNAGIIIQDAVNSTTDATLLWKTATDTFEFSHPIKAKSDLTLSSSGGDAGIYWKDSSASDATAWHLHADVTQATTNLLLNYAGGGTNFSFVNNGNFLAPGTIFADGAASNSLQWEAGYDYSQVGHLPLAGGNLTGNVRFGNTSVGTEDDNEYLMSTGGQLIIRANDSAADDSYTYLILDSGNASGAASAYAGVMTRTNGVERLRVGGDGTIKFFEDTGTTAKLVWNPTSEELQFADNAKATFGAGDLQIYHNANNSYIQDVGTGKLHITSDGTGVSIDKGTSEVMATFDTDGAVTLYHNALVKLATTAIGADITGVLTADGLTVDTSATGGFKVEDRGAEGAGVKVTAYQGTTNSNVRQLDVDAYQLTVSTGSVTGTTVTDRLLIADNGNISFFEDTGTTAKLTWDASAESLNFADNGKATFGAGDLQIFHDGSNSYIKDSGTGSLLIDATNLYLRNSSGEEYASFISDGAANLKYNGSTRIATTATGIDVTGSVTADSVVVGDTSSSFSAVYVTSSATGESELRLGDTDTDAGSVSYTNSDDTMTFRAAAGARMSLDSSGLDVTGTATMDGITNNGDVVFSKSSTGVPTLKMSGFAGANSPYGVINFYNEDGSQQGPNNAVQIKALAKNSDGSGGELAFYTSTGTSSEGADAVERMRIDSSGQVLIGTTLNVFGGADRYGYNFFANGQSNQSIDGSNSVTAQYINRENADGAFSKFYKDRAEVGSLGVNATRPYIASSAMGLKIAGSEIHSTSATGVSTDATYNLGSSLFRWKDLYLSGTIALTTADNASAANMFVSPSTDFLYLEHPANGMIFRNTSGVERMRIDSSGNVGIGNSSPSSMYSTANNLVIGDSGNSGMTIKSTGGIGAISFADDVSGSGRYRGQIAYSHSGDYLRFNTAATERMRIMQDGAVVINPLNGDGQIYFNATTGNLTMFLAKSGLETLLWNRANGAMRFGTNDTERLRIDSSGNVGIGLDNPSFRLHVLDTIGTRTLSLGHGVSSGAITTDAAKDLNFQQAGSTKMTLTSGGNVGISVTPSALVMPDGSTGALQFQQGGMLSAYAGAFHISQNWYYNSGEKYIANGSASRYYQKDGNHVWETAGNNTSGAGAGATLSESMRLSGGNLLLGTTSAVSGSASGVQVLPAGFIRTGRGATTGETHLEFYNPNGRVGLITTAGTTTAYNTSSDQRLKENIADADDAGSKVDAIQVRKFDWKADGSHQDYGMIAQELIEVAPEAVSAPEDADEMMGVDYSKLVPMLVKEIQQLRKRVKDLED